MKIILDTNVFVSAVFFGGTPYKILDAWRSDSVQIVISPEILEEYRRIGERLSAKYKGVSLTPMLELLTINAQVFISPELPNQICDDKDDDKFIACAIASGARYIVSGDKHLLDVSGYNGIETLKPRAFVERFL